LPIDTAIKMAPGGDADIQRALSEAHGNGTLRGAELRAVQQLFFMPVRRATAQTGRNNNEACDKV
jgi:hypothetical protein